MSEVDWGGNSRSAYAQLGASNHSEGEREKRDFYATHPNATELLMKAETFQRNIWEPAAGKLHITKVLEKYGYEVKSTDICGRGCCEEQDFLQATEKWQGDIISNPPYKNASEFVEHALELVENGAKVAMFLKIQFLESAKRYELFKKYPPKRVLVCVKRQQCAKNGDFETYSNGTGTAICYAWYIWEKGYTGAPTIGWLI